MKHITGSIELYGKKLLQQMGVCEEEMPLQDNQWQSEGPLWADRRLETRSSRTSSCTYTLMRSVDRDGVTLEEGPGTTVDTSPTGMRLLLGIAPCEGQLLEVQTSHSNLRRAHYLLEVCWTKPLREDEQGALYLVGCRVNFGTTHLSIF